MVSTPPLISKSSGSCTNPLFTVPSAPFTIGITVTLLLLVVVLVVVVVMIEWEEEEERMHACVRAWVKFGMKFDCLFVAASHQTGLDTWSKARRPIKWNEVRLLERGKKVGKIRLACFARDLASFEYKWSYYQNEILNKRKRKSNFSEELKYILNSLKSFDNCISQYYSFVSSILSFSITHFFILISWGRNVLY